MQYLDSFISFYAIFLFDESCATACYSYVISPLVNSYIISSYVFGRCNQYKSKDVQVYGNESPWRCENKGKTILDIYLKRFLGFHLFLLSNT